MVPTVFAYRDDGPQSETTRWKPRRVFCTLERDHSDAPGTLYVVKFAGGPSGAAALISEIVSTNLLSVGGFRTLSPAIVRVSEGFASSCNRKSDYPARVEVSDYFGTLHRSDVEAGPPPSYDDVAQPLELLRLWVFDTWLCNIDREVEGNILLALSSNGKFHVVAADHSDCFCGASVFCSAEFRRAMETRGPAASVPYIAEVIFRNGGASAIRRAVRDVRAVVPTLGAAMDLVPLMWWQRSGLTPRDVTEALTRRANRLDDILNPSQWEVPDANNAILL